MKNLLFITILLCSYCLVSAQTEDEVLGKWVNANGKAHIEIYKTNNKYHGKIIWLREPNDKDGKIKLDSKNPDDKLKLKPLLGLNILRNFEFNNNEWSGGRIYDPENGKDYKCYMKLKDKSKLAIRGYIGISLLGRTEIWSRIN